MLHHVAFIHSLVSISPVFPSPLMERTTALPNIKAWFSRPQQTCLGFFLALIRRVASGAD